MQETHDKRENTFAGFLGALIGAIIGIAAWMIVGNLGYNASLTGLVAAFVSGKLYDVFGGRPGVMKVVILIVCAIITVFGGTFGSFYLEARELYDEEFEKCVELFKEYYDADDEEARAESEIIMDESYGGRTGFFMKLTQQSENQKALKIEVLNSLVCAFIGCALYGSRKMVIVRGHREVRMMAEGDIKAEHDTEE